MTEQEAIFRLKTMENDAFERGGYISMDARHKEVEVAIKALEEIQQYRAIGPVEQVRESVEKMKPRQPKCIDEEYGTFDCPSCGRTIIAIDDMTVHQNCLMCGQKLNWDFSD